MKKLLFVSALFLALAASASAQQRFVATLTGTQEVPANNSQGRGTCRIVLNAAETSISVTCSYFGLSSNASAGHIHGNAAVGVNAPVLFGFTGIPASTSGTIGPFNFAVTPAQVADMRAHLFYVNIHTSSLPGGEIRGQVKQIQTVYDIDGDGRTDAAIFRQSTNQLWFQSSLNGTALIYPLGTGAGDIFLNNTYDFDGDGRGDPLLLKLDANSVATWTILQTDTNTIRSVQWGLFTVASNDTLAPADYDGDGKQDIGVFRRSTGDWYVIESASGNSRVTHWGTVNDFPSIGDYDGDGKADLTAVRVESGQRVWYTLRSSDAQSTRTVWGASATDGVFFFAPFDIDGDGKQDIAVNRIVSSQRQFLVLRSSNGQPAYINWGLNTDTALFGDYDGDGKTDLVARRNVGGSFQWYILRSSDGALMIINWGISTDQ